MKTKSSLYNLFIFIAGLSLAFSSHCSGRRFQRKNFRKQNRTKLFKVNHPKKSEWIKLGKIKHRQELTEVRKFVKRINEQTTEALLPQYNPQQQNTAGLTREKMWTYGIKSDVNFLELLGNSTNNTTVYGNSTNSNDKINKGLNTTEGVTIGLVAGCALCCLLVAKTQCCAIALSNCAKASIAGCILPATCCFCGTSCSAGCCFCSMLEATGLHCLLNSIKNQDRNENGYEDLEDGNPPIEPKKTIN